MIVITLREDPTDCSDKRWSAIRDDMPGGIGLGETAEAALANLGEIVGEYNTFVAGEACPHINPEPVARYDVLTRRGSTFQGEAARPTAAYGATLA